MKDKRKWHERKEGRKEGREEMRDKKVRMKLSIHVHVLEL